MSQTLQNQILIAKSMNGIVSLSDGAGTTIENGNIICDDLTGLTLTANTTNTTNMTLQNLTMTGSLNLPAVNDIVTTYGNVSLKNAGNSYLTNNVYLNGYLLPYFNLSVTSMRMGLNAMKNQEATSTDNIVFGLNAAIGTTNTGGSYNNSFQKSIVIGNGAFQSTTYGTYSTLHTDNVIIGTNSCKGTNAANQYNVIIGSETCSSNNAGGNQRSVIIGYGIGRTRGYYSDAVIIGANNLINISANSAAIVGSGNFSNANIPSGYANGAFVFGVNNLTTAINFNSVIAIGDTVFTNMNAAITSIGIGRLCGQGLVNGYFNILMGQSVNCQGSTTNSTSIGHNSTLTADDNNTFLIAGNDAGLQGLGYTKYQDLCIRNKNRILCGYFNTAAIVNLTFELAEHYIITDPATITINLPTPAIYNQNLGTRFTMVRAAISSTITINAPSGQYIRFDGLYSSTYTFSSGESYVTLVCCGNGAGNVTWCVTSSQQVNTGGFPLGTKVNSIYPYYVSSQCDLWTTSTASIINIGNQTTPQIINFSKINTNSIEPKAVGTDLNLFTTTIASFLNFGNSGNYLTANFYLNPKFFGTSIHTGASTFNGGITATATQTINFGTNAPYMRGDNIVANSIGQTQIDSGYLDLFTNQTIPFGVKTFTNPPVMSGASITVNSIPNSALQTNVTLNDTTSTISAVKTFTAAPIMSGASITSGTIGQTQLSNGYLDLSSDQTITAGIKKFSTAPSTGFQSLTGSGTVTFSLTGGKDVFLTGTGITAVTLPTPTTASIGQVFVLIRNGITIGNSYVIGTQVGTDRILVDGAVLATYQTSFSQASITVTAIATSGNCWVLSNFNNVNGLMMSKYIYPLFGGFALPSNSSYADVNLISLGSGCLNANTNAGYRNNAGCVYIGANVCNVMTSSPTGVTIIGNSGFIATTSGTINNTTAIGGDTGKLYAQTGTGNTLIGFGADFTAASSFSNSTALGTGALISASNQVVLGRTTETVIMPSAKVQYGGSYRPNSVYQTINGTNLDWNASPPTNLPQFILFSCSASTVVNLTLPAISNANVYEGMEFQFRRTNTFTSATTTSSLITLCSGTDTIYVNGSMATAPSAIQLASGAFYSRLVCVNKTTTPYNWAYFP